MRFTEWLSNHFEIAFILTPLVIKHSRIGNNLAYTGFTSVYVFGIRVAKIQRTHPW